MSTEKSWMLLLPVPARAEVFAAAAADAGHELDRVMAAIGKGYQHPVFR